MDGGSTDAGLALGGFASIRYGPSVGGAIKRIALAFAFALATSLVGCSSGDGDGANGGGAGSPGSGGVAGVSGAAGGGESDGGVDEPDLPPWNEPSGLPEAPVGPSELFGIVSQIGGFTKHGMPHMAGGRLVVPTPEALRFFDVSDPTAPTEVSRVEHAIEVEHYVIAFTKDLGATHAFTSGAHGAAVWDLTDLENPAFVADVVVGNGGSLEYVNRAEAVGLQAPLLFVPTSVSGIVVVDVSDPSNASVLASISPSDVGLTKTGYALAVGNVLYTSCHSCAGVATIDISDPSNPTLLAAFTDAVAFGYGLTVAGDELLLAAKGESGSVGVQVFDVSDPEQILLGEKWVGGAPHGGDGGYVAVQDGFVHFGGSALGYFKLDLQGTEVGRIALADVPGAQDVDYATTFGHLGILADDDAATTSLFFHREEPDASGPEVMTIVPANGAVDQALTTRVGVVMSDWVDYRSLHPATFFVRPNGGDPVAGRLSVQQGVVNFAPEAPLDPDTTYQVVIRELRDHVGNPSARFESHFTTGGG